MYIIDARHFLNDKGDIGPDRGPTGRKMADFVTALIAHESDVDRSDTPDPGCFKCRKGPVDTMMSDTDAILWRCPLCSTEASLSNWQGTFWDPSQARPAD